MSQEEIMNEILAKLPAEIVEKMKSNTITEEELKEYILPLAEQYKEQLEGFAPLSEEQLEAVSGGNILDDLAHSIVNIFNKLVAKKEKAEEERLRREHPELFMEARVHGLRR